MKDKQVENGKDYRGMPVNDLEKALGFAVCALVLLLLSGCASMQAPKAPEAVLPPTLMSSPKSVPPAGAPPRSLDPTGSIWARGDDSLYSDIKAHKVGDLVTITVSESSTGSNTASTSTSKASANQGSIAFSGVGIGSATPSKAAFSLGPYKTSFTGTFAGSGSTSRTDTVSAYMTATVVAVLPNGNLVIRGSRWTKVNDELQQIVLEGVVRPVDISDTNTILSQDVAEAKIFMLGKGPVSHNQKPGWLQQVWDTISPF